MKNKEEILENKLKEHGIRKGWINESKQAVLDAMEEYVDKKHEIFLKEFEVTRLTNGRGHSHLLVVTEEAVEDRHIGSVVIVPYAEGFKDPIKVLLHIDENGMPITFNEKFVIVSKYIY